MHAFRNAMSNRRRRACQPPARALLLLLTGTLLLLMLAGRASAQLPMHPEVRPTLPASRFNTDLGNWGEAAVNELLKSRGYEVTVPKVGSNGPDFIATKRDASGMITDAIVGEVKTRTAEGDVGAPSLTKKGLQLSPEKVMQDLERASKHAKDPAVRKLCDELLAKYKANPASLRCERHVLTLDDGKYRIYKATSNTRVNGRPVANGSLDEIFERLSKSSNPEIAKPARENLRYLRKQRALVRQGRPVAAAVRQIPKGALASEAGLIVQPPRVAGTAFHAGALTAATIAGFAAYEWTQGQISDARFHEELIRAGADGLAVYLTTGAVLLFTPGAPGVVLFAVGAATVYAVDTALDWMWQRENEHAIARQVELVHGSKAAEASADPLAPLPPLANPLGEALAARAQRGTRRDSPRVSACWRSKRRLPFATGRLGQRPSRWAMGSSNGVANSLTRFSQRRDAVDWSGSIGTLQRCRQ